MKSFVRAGLSLAALGVFCGAVSVARADDNAPPSPPVTIQGEVTFAKDVAPIIYQSCSGCHRPGQIGPMSLMSYDEVRPWAKSIRKSVSDHKMPPWHADPHFGKFRNDRSLSEEQVAKLTAWVDQGAPSGDLATAPAPPKFENQDWSFGNPDQVFGMGKPFEVADDVEDLYEHFIISTNLEEDKSLIAMELKAGAPRMVHHILVFVLPPDMDVTHGMPEGSGLMKSMFLTGWAPGTDALKYLDGYGKIIPAHSKLLFQLHYHKQPGPGTGGSDQSFMAVKWAKEPVKNPTTTAWVMDPTISIPPGDENYESTSQFKFIDDGYILGLVPHMHLRGKNFSFEAHYPDGTVETLLQVPRYDFNWQTAYELAEPKAIPSGTVIKAIAHWDNSAKNPSNPDPNQTVYFSERTTDEMMIGFMEYSYNHKKNMQGKFGMPEKVSQRMAGGLTGQGGGGFSAFAPPGDDEHAEARRAAIKEKMKNRRVRVDN